MIKRPTSDSEARGVDLDDHPLTATHQQPKLNVFVLVLGLLIVGALVAYGVIPRIMLQHTLNTHTQALLLKAPAVTVTVVGSGPAVEEFILPGSSEAIQDAPIYARVDGYLHHRYANIGDLVHAGQLLADIDTPELDQQVQAASSAVEQASANLDNTKQALEKSQADERTAEANVHKARTDLQYFDTQLGRYKELAKLGAVSVEDRDTRQQAFSGGTATLDALIAAEKSAKSSISSARAAMHVAQAALNAAQFQRDQIIATRSFRKVTAPFDGVVTKRNVDAGALITAGSNTGDTLLFEIAKTDVLRVSVYVPEQYISYVHVGEKAGLDFQEYPGIDFLGTVTNVSGGVDPTSKTLEVEIHVPNSKHKLMPGMYAQVHFHCASAIRMPILPATAIQTRADGSYVYIVDNQRRVHLHKLELGRDLGGEVEVIKGTVVGDRAVIDPPDELEDGKTVTPVRASTSGT